MLPLLYAILLLSIICISIAIIALTYSIRRHRRITRGLYQLNQKIDQVPRFVWSATNLNKFVPDNIPLPPWNDWALHPDSLSLVLSLVLERKPMRIVEFGSGISTLLIANAARQYGGSMISVEHDGTYADVQRNNLEKFGLHNAVDLRVCPITAERFPPFGHPWYDIDWLDRIDDVDLVVIDGPPMTYGAEVRFPGADRLIAKLRPGGSIILDDAARPGEQRIKRALEERYPGMIFSEPPTVRGCLIVTKPH